MLPLNIPFQTIDSKSIIKESKFSSPKGIEKTLNEEVVVNGKLKDLVQFKVNLKGRSGNIHNMIYEFKRDYDLEKSLGSPLFIKSFYKSGVEEKDQYKIINDLSVSDALVYLAFYISYHAKTVLSETNNKKSIYYLNIWKDADEENTPGHLTRRGKVYSRMAPDLVNFGEKTHGVDISFENKIDYFLLTIVNTK